MRRVESLVKLHPLQIYQMAQEPGGGIKSKADSLVWLSDFQLSTIRRKELEALSPDW